MISKIWTTMKRWAGRQSRKMLSHSEMGKDDEADDDDDDMALTLHTTTNIQTETNLRQTLELSVAYRLKGP